MRAVALALGFVCALSQAMEPSTPQAKGSTALGGVTLWELFEPVSARLGKPRLVVDDKGAAFGVQYIYEGMTLWAGFNADRHIVVQQIEVTNPRYCTPSGLCPGMKAPDVPRILGHPILSGAVKEGRNSFLIGEEACWLEVSIRNSVITQLAIRCQP